MLRLLSSKEASPSQATPAPAPPGFMFSVPFGLDSSHGQAQDQCGKGLPKSLHTQTWSLGTITVIIYPRYEERCPIYRLEVKWKSLSHVWLFVTPMDYTIQSMEFSRQEYWRIPFSRGSSRPRSPTLQEDSSPAESQGKPKNTGVASLSLLQWIFLTQESNQGLMHCRQVLYQLSYQGSPFIGLAFINNLFHLTHYILQWLADHSLIRFWSILQSSL